jgi:hypothetical protein
MKTRALLAASVALAALSVAAPVAGAKDVDVKGTATCTAGVKAKIKAGPRDPGQIKTNVQIDDRGTVRRAWQIVIVDGVGVDDRSTPPPPARPTRSTGTCSPRTTPVPTPSPSRQPAPAPPAPARSPFPDRLALGDVTKGGSDVHGGVGRDPLAKRQRSRHARQRRRQRDEPQGRDRTSHHHSPDRIGCTHTALKHHRGQPVVAPDEAVGCEVAGERLPHCTEHGLAEAAEHLADGDQHDGRDTIAMCGVIAINAKAAANHRFIPASRCIRGRPRVPSEGLRSA